MDDGPIREEQTIFRKIKDAYNRVFKKPEPENYFISPYKVNRELNTYEKDVWRLKEAAMKFGVSAQEASDGILNLREITSFRNMFSNCTTLKEIPVMKINKK